MTIKDMNEFKVKNIKWDTDEKGLPKVVVFPNDAFISKYGEDDFEDEEELLDVVADFLSDEYGFCHDGFEVENEGHIFNKKNYMVTVTDTATYIIKASSEEEARNCAWDYFTEREPSIEIEETDEEAEIEI